MTATTAAISGINIADLGTIVASGELALAPASRLQNAHVGRKWRVNATSANLTIDLGASYSIDTYGLFGCNLTSTGTTRVRASLSDATATGSLLYDSTSAAGRILPAYGALISLDDAPVTVRYVRIDLSDATLTYIEAGRLFIGLRNQFSINFAPGQSSGRTDPSTRQKSRGGQTHVNDMGDIFRVWDFTFTTINATERNGFVETIDLTNGARTDVLLIKDPTSSNLGRDSIWGLMTEIGPIIVTNQFIGSANAYSKTYRIEERK